MNIDERINMLQLMGVLYHQSYHYIKKYLSDNRSISVEYPLLLYTIQKNQPILQKDLASIMQLKPATMSVHLKNLEKKGWIKREDGEHDKRQTFVSITDSGKQLLSHAYDMMLKLTHDMTDELSDEEVKEMQTLVTKILNHLETKGECPHA